MAVVAINQRNFYPRSWSMHNSVKFTPSTSVQNQIGTPMHNSKLADSDTAATESLDSDFSGDMTGWAMGKAQLVKET
jgi:hypothetical protein